MTSSSIEFDDIELIKIKTINTIDECTFSNECKIALFKCYNISLNIDDNNYSMIFDYILTQIIHLTKSIVGGICEKVVIDREEYLKFITIAKEEVCENTKKFHSTELNNLLGRAIDHNIIVISNNPSSDSRSSGIPVGHFKIERFMGIPLIINEICIGQIILANKSNDYTEQDIYNIYPLIKLCADTILNINYKKKYTIADILQSKSDVLKVKDNFLTTMSHEIRTPLTGIMGAVTLLPQAGTLNSKQHEHLKIATTCSIQLLELINGILDFSRLSSNTLALVKEPFNIKECIDNSITIVQTRAEEKKLKIYTEIENIPNSIIGDDKRLRQVLVNILSNAIKFTDKGFINLKVYSKQYSERNTPSEGSPSGTSPIGSNYPEGENDLFWKIIFEIKDTGSGISSKDQSQLFKAFSQIHDNNVYNKQDGAGLGLAISKELIELMGGEIKVHSDGLGHGSTFIFDINVEEDINIEDMLSKHHNIIENVTILNVDDKMENLLILDEMLYRWNINSIMCNNAEQALRYLEHGKTFHIAIIDICMPYMSGIELAQRLRELYPHLPLIGISSIGYDKQGEEWFDVYLTKPYNQSKILKSIVRCLIQNETSISLQNKKVNKLQCKKTKDTLKILVAEDDKSTQFMVKEMIITLGYNGENIKIVDNGEKCVAEVKKDNYNVCLMDIKMPIMDGLEASRHIRQLENRPALIAMSAGVMESDKHS